MNGAGHHRNPTALSSQIQAGAIPPQTVIASFHVPHQAAWLKAARSHGKITLIYGLSIGVRRPDHLPASQHGNNARAAELMRSCQEGTLSWGIIQFRK